METQWRPDRHSHCWIRKLGLRVKHHPMSFFTSFSYFNRITHYILCTPNTHIFILYILLSLLYDVFYALLLYYDIYYVILYYRCYISPFILVYIPYYIMLICYTFILLHNISILIQTNTKYNYLIILYAILVYTVIVDGIILLYIYCTLLTMSLFLRQYCSISSLVILSLIALG